MTDDGVVFAECTEIDDDTFDRFYREVLEPAFPPAELSGLEEMRAAFRLPLPGCFGMVALNDGEPIGGALGEYSASSGVLLLAYLAIRPGIRGGGLGGRLLGRALPCWREATKPVVTLAEIEDPRFHRGSEGHGDPTARVRFYERHGARVLPLPYFQPSLGAGLPRVRGMLLICLDPEQTAVPADALLRFLDEYVEQCEGPEAVRSDPEYGRLRDQLSGGPVEVPLWPLARAGEVPSATGE
ncbi:GNAT family N-acetyltransferase [Actinomadura craniellae]|nr:GNAT family N-acetyltransferase [Actinomadura craniellae]